MYVLNDNVNVNLNLNYSLSQIFGKRAYPKFPLSGVSGWLKGYYEGWARVGCHFDDIFGGKDRKKIRKRKR